MPPRQSAYRQFHSTEPDVSKVFNDLLQAADDGEVSALCLLDRLTAAFDTVDHDLMLLKLERKCEMCRCEDTSTAVSNIVSQMSINGCRSANRLKLNPEKTEYLWSGSRHSLRKLGGCGPTIKLGTDTIKASGPSSYHMSSELNLE